MTSRGICRAGAALVGMLVVGVPVSVPAVDLHVDRTAGSDAADGLGWATAKASLGAALAEAEALPGVDTVFVAEGWYVGSFIIPAETLLVGGYPSGGGIRDVQLHPAVLHGAGAGTVVTFGPGTDGGLLDGFTVRGGATEDPAAAGGITIVGSVVTILNCIVEANRGCGAGGVYIEALGLPATPRVWDSVVRGNTATCAAPAAGGLSIVTDASAAIEPILRGCLVSGNVAAPSLIGGPFAGMIAGGLSISGRGRIEHCAFRANRPAGARLFGDPRIHFFNCEFSDHPAWGVVGRCDVDFVLEQCTLARNGAGAVTNLGSPFSRPWSFEFHRGIAWGNGTLGFPWSGGCLVLSEVISDSLVEGGEPAGTDILDADPGFVAGPAGDFYLSQVSAGGGQDSPALDAGNVSAVLAGLDALMTRVDSVSDSGAVDLGVHYPASGQLTVLRGTDPRVLTPIGSVSNLPYDDSGVFPDPARPLLFYRVLAPRNEVRASKAPSPGAVRLAF